MSVVTAVWLLEEGESEIRRKPKPSRAREASCGLGRAEDLLAPHEVID